MAGLVSGMGTTRAPLKDRRDDLYETPPEAVTALMSAERLPYCIWEPACGPGAIVRVLRGVGHNVLATDLVDYDSPDQDEARRDFLIETRSADQVPAIVTNPPFKLAHQFVKVARWRSPLTIMLLRLAFLESVARTDILEAGDLARVWVFRERLPMMHRAGWKGRKSNSGMAFAWFVWRREHKGPTEMRRLSWRGAP